MGTVVKPFERIIIPLSISFKAKSVFRTHFIQTQSVEMIEMPFIFIMGNKIMAISISTGSELNRSWIVGPLLLVWGVRFWPPLSRTPLSLHHRVRLWCTISIGDGG